MVFLRKLKSKIFNEFIIYFSSSVINRAIPFFLLPILTRYLTTEEYGLLAIYQVMISFSMPLIGLSMPLHITRNFYEKTKDFLAKMVFNLLVVLTFSSSLVLITIAIYLGLGGEQFTIPKRWLYALPLIAFMGMINSFNLTILRNRKRPKEYGGFEITKTGLDLFISIILIVLYSYSWEGRAIGILIATILIGFISLIRIWKSGYLILKLDIKKIKEIFRISMPLIPHALGGVILTLGDRLFINQMISTSAVGIYTIGYQFGMIMLLIVTAFNKTWSPWVYEKLSNPTKKNKSQIVKATYLISLAFILLAIGVTIASHFLLPFMTAAEYHGGIIFVIWIALGYAFNGMYTLVFPYGVHVGSTSYLGITTLLAALINLVANYFLIPLHGPLGAAQATLISYIFMFLSVWWYSNKLYPMPWFTFMKTSNS